MSLQPPFAIPIGLAVPKQEQNALVGRCLHQLLSRLVLLGFMIGEHSLKEAIDE